MEWQELCRRLEKSIFGFQVAGPVVAQKLQGFLDYC